MLKEKLFANLRSLIHEEMPLPGRGDTASRHRKLMYIGRLDLSVARLAEAHWDAIAILAEAGRTAEPGIVYGVWTSERTNHALSLSSCEDGFVINGKKMFCSGAGIIDRTLVTVVTPVPQLVEVDLRRNAGLVHFDESDWKTSAFRETKTATVTFSDVPICEHNLIGEPGWYLERPGFWHGACGPAACWAGGAAGLVDYAAHQTRNDPHTLAHLGAMHASIWALEAYLDKAGMEIDATVNDRELAMTRALTVRHLVEQACTEVLRRLPRAYGPHPLATDERVALRYQELDLYLRQSHAERDLESLGKILLNSGNSGESHV